METAELRYDAPLATFDSDEWNEFNIDVEVIDESTRLTQVTNRNVVVDDNDSSKSHSLSVSNRMMTSSSCSGSSASSPSSVAIDDPCGRTSNSGCRDDTRGDDDENDEAAFSGSLEDLVNCFDERIRNCFRNYDEQADRFAPVQIRTEEEVLKESQTWWTITGNFGNTLPINWSKQLVCPRYAESISQWSSDTNQSDFVDSETELDGDDPLSPRDYDAGVAMEPVATADDVINEIESMLETCNESDELGSRDDLDDVSDERSRVSLPPRHRDVTSSVEGLHRILATTTQDESRHLATYVDTTPVDGKSLCRMSSYDLSNLVSQLRRRVRDFSEVLVRELALRDELDYEKELRNQFIWLLLRVHRRRRDHRLLMKSIDNVDGKSPCSSRRGLGNANIRSPNGNGHDVGACLVTVIPYDADLGTPGSTTLQIFIKILSAIDQDSSALPSLLTDYILNVLCPPTTT